MPIAIDKRYYEHGIKLVNDITSSLITNQPTPRRIVPAKGSQRRPARLVRILNGKLIIKEIS